MSLLVGAVCLIPEITDSAGTSDDSSCLHPGDCFVSSTVGCHFLPADVLSPKRVRGSVFPSPLVNVQALQQQSATAAQVFLMNPKSCSMFARLCRSNNVLWRASHRVSRPTAICGGLLPSKFANSIHPFESACQTVHLTGRPTFSPKADYVSSLRAKADYRRTDIERRDQSSAFRSSAPLLGLLLPGALAPASLSLSEYRWIFEDLVSLPGIGSLGLGLPGVVSLGIFLNPMFEAMPRIRKLGHVGDMPMLPYSAMASQGSVWTAYGLLLSNPAVWTPNLCAAMLGMYYMSIYFTHCKDVGNLFTHVVKVVATMGFAVFAYALLPHDLALNLLGITGNVMTIIMFGGPLTAIRTVVREQNTRALNLGFTCIVNLNCILWFFYAYFMLDDPYIYLQDGVGIILATMQLGLFARYGVQRH